MWIWIAVAVVVVLLVLFLIWTYNRLVQDRNRVDQAWSQVDVQLRLRYDLVPNLVETVKGYAAHERQTLEAVIGARNQAVQATGPEEQGQAEGLLTGALGRLFALAEAYPDLKANQNFLNLQEELTSIEGKIAYARQYYNDSVYNYNTRVQSVPSNLMAKPFGFTEREYFEVEGEGREPVRVQF